MGLDIAGATIVTNAASGVSLNMLVFNSIGQGTANAIPGYLGAKNAGANYFSGTTGWEMNNFSWQSGMHPTNGIFTCPVAGIYAMGYNGIHRGGSGRPAGLNTYGYSCFAKNGVMAYHTHWNQGSLTATTVWHSGGASGLFQCAAGDTLALFVNRAPSPVGPDCQAQNYGLYPNEHHAVWCKLVG